MAEIITEVQEKFLKLFSKSTLSKQFYFSGGTALSYYYLNHRYSEDLDFFSEEEFDIVQISVFLKSIKKENKKNEMTFQNIIYTVALISGVIFFFIVYKASKTK